ncbi:HNH/ENDO VII family nuclease [Prosthecobacter debontii]
MKESGAWEPTQENLARIERGKPPIGNDGLPVELHHRNQNPAGPLDEMTSTTHDTVPHPISPSQIDRVKFSGERTRYWRGRARTLNGQE